MKKSITEVFGIQAPATITVDVRDNAIHAMIPRSNPDYVFRREILSDILAWMKGAAGTDPLYLVGPTGSGKSSIITQIAARLGIPLYVVSCHERMEIPELFGRFVVRSGEMEWVDGPFIQGLKDPASAWILLDEADTLDPGTFVGLNALLEGRSIIVPETGETIDPLRFGARIIYAGNTAGNGDTTGLYQSTKRQNLASMGRFMMLEVGYANAAEEDQALGKAVPEVPSPIRQKMIEVANKVRDLFRNGEIEVTFCTRTLIRWAQLATFFKAKPGINPMTYALDRALGFRAEPASRQALHELVQRIIA
ncbi:MULTISPECIES: AAA family ATPase [Geobacteraceae]|uniref:AAA family ATPase n=2 Tax=Geobacteraceae TaxID=213422 RepID=A0A8J7LW70_9BACT|nr:MULTISPECIES: AAA family ATPase [Geobacteraceae]MBJ6726389.1 AAA family ATPase [Geomesophilobacter sediminis]BDV41558.1 ATPase [Geotalea uraniireducens]